MLRNVFIAIGVLLILGGGVAFYFAREDQQDREAQQGICNLGGGAGCPVDTGLVWWPAATLIVVGVLILIAMPKITERSQSSSAPSR